MNAQHYNLSHTEARYMSEATPAALYRDMSEGRVHDLEACVDALISKVHGQQNMGNRQDNVYLLITATQVDLPAELNSRLLNEAIASGCEDHLGVPIQAIRDMQDLCNGAQACLNTYPLHNPSQKLEGGLGALAAKNRDLDDHPELRGNDRGQHDNDSQTRNHIELEEEEPDLEMGMS